MTEFTNECVCGGNQENPNDDCERCQMVLEIRRHREEITWLRNRDIGETKQQEVEND